MHRRASSEWASSVQTIVTAYESVAQDFYRLALSSPQDTPVNLVDYRHDVLESFHAVESTYASWRERPFDGKQHDAARFHAYQQSTSFVSALLGLYLELMPWTGEWSDQHRTAALEQALVIKRQLTSWFLVLHDLSVIDGRDAPTLAGLIDRMAPKSSDVLRTVRAEVEAWGRPTAGP